MPSQPRSEDRFYLPPDPGYTLADSAAASVRFVRERCLTRYRGHASATSTFVDVEGVPQLWHDFGPIEGVGWAANAAGGAYELLRWAAFTQDASLQAIAISLIDHVLEAGFLVPETGFIRPYRHVGEDRFYLNYLHKPQFDVWFCPGATARVACQLLLLSDHADTGRAARLREAAFRCGRWLLEHVKPLPNGWYPRRVTPEGRPYEANAHGRGQDPQFDHSGDGLFIVQLLLMLSERGLLDGRQEAAARLEAFMRRGGCFGSINHDTYDDHENVAYAVAFRTLLQASKVLKSPELEAEAFRCLDGLTRFEMCEDRNGVATTGLLWMEASWNTAYLWENAEAALAYLEAYAHRPREAYLSKGLTILRAIARHHYGPHGFLTEGVDWDNCVGAQHHIDGAQFGAIRYTEPFLNHLHFLEPTLLYFEQLAPRRDEPDRTLYLDPEGSIAAA
ncbi:MAG TPA: hypothetical protein VF234_00810, partial [Limnochordia bacterium]